MSETLSANLLLDYLVELGTGLLSAGCPTHRLEDLLGVVAAHEGFECDAFAVPTGLFLSVRTPEGAPPAMQMVRVREWSTNLERLAALDEVLNGVADRTVTVAEARRRIAAITNKTDTWSPRAVTLATMGASAGAAVSLGGDQVDFVLAAMGALALRGLMYLARGSPTARFLENFLGGAVAGLVAWLSTLVWPTHSREVLVLSVIIPLLPGMVLTTGLAELTYRNLVSGTARLMEAAVTLLALVFGILVMLGLEQRFGFKPEPAAPVIAASWPFQLLALVTAAISFGVLLGLRREWLWVALLSDGVVWAASQATRALPGFHAAFLAAMALSVAANIYARVSQRPSQLFSLPGLLLLVPGAFGFRSLDALLRGDYTAGAGQFADMVLTAAALVMGLLVANVVLPSRKIL